MGKYSSLEKDVFSVFNSTSWKSEKLKTYPSNFIPVDPGNEFIKVTILPSGLGLNLKSVSGMVLVDIFISVGGGPKKASLIADLLDSYLVGKHIITSENNTTQFFISSMQPLGNDKDNPTLYVYRYSIPFNYYGVF
jgi:hypothetical protein